MEFQAGTVDIVTLLAAISAVIGSVAAVIVAIRGRHMTHREIKEVHVSLDGRLEELLELTRKTAHAAGLAEGRAEPDE